jgi:hypothetical protein
MELHTVHLLLIIVNNFWLSAFWLPMKKFHVKFVCA